MNRAICLAALAVLAGCAATPRYDRHFGDAVRQARTAMTMNPAGSANRDDEVKGIDGQAAAAALTRYQDSFKAAPPPQPLIKLPFDASAGPATGGGNTK
jgi:hypothetical protein